MENKKFDMQRPVCWWKRTQNSCAPCRRVIIFIKRKMWSTNGHCTTRPRTQKIIFMHMRRIKKVLITIDSVSLSHSPFRVISASKEIFVDKKSKERSSHQAVAKRNKTADNQKWWVQKSMVIKCRDCQRVECRPRAANDSLDYNSCERRTFRSKVYEPKYKKTANASTKRSL